MPSAASAPSAAQIWGMANPAHSIQKAVAIVTFAEPITSLTLRKVQDAVRPVAKAQGLLKEEPVSSVLFEMKPGAKPKAVSDDKVGTSFQNVQGENISEAFNVTNDGLRFETSVYTRWVAFENKLRSLVQASLPITSMSAPIRQVTLEYTDFFYARIEGDQDVSYILDRRSGLISPKVFARRAPFHCHNGWFEGYPGDPRFLVNVDINVADANGPPGLRRSITIRTHEAEQIVDIFGPRATALSDAAQMMSCLDNLHRRLKDRLSDVLTRDARAMISLGK